MAQVREAMRGAGFDGGTLCRVLNISALSELGSLQRGEIDFSKVPGTLALSIKVFLFGELVARDEFESRLDASTREALLALDLVRANSSAGKLSLDGNGFYSPVFLYPVDGFLIATDIPKCFPLWPRARAAL